MGVANLFDGMTSGQLLLRGLSVLIGVPLAYFLYVGYTVRRRFQRWQKQGVPMMKHSPIFGHLPQLGKLMAGLPSDAHGDHLLLFIKQNWQTLFPNYKSCPPVVYVDTWPFTAPIAISLDPGTSAQFTQDVSRVKPVEQKRFLKPLTGNLDLSSQEGPEWKIWRKRLSPGFSNATITSRLSDLIEEVEVFANILRGKAGKNGSWGELFPLEDKTINLTFDVIGRYLLDIRLHDQTGSETPLKSGLLDTLQRVHFYRNPINIWSELNPYRSLRLWLNTRKMNAFLLPHIQARISSSSSSTSTTDKKEKNQFLRLTVNSIKDEESSSGGPIDHASFIANASGQIKVFLFAGHDTTASTLCWVFHCLLRNPQSLSKLRSELTAVLGPGPAAPALRANPHLVNALTYTTAVVKETLRLQTNVGTMRQGGRGFDLVGPEGSEFAGARFPTEGCVLWDGNWAIHRDPALWARADEFVPERWLCADEGDPLHPVRNAYRPFELGPRDCIGQHLAMVEMKLVLALVVREFDIMEDWEAWDEVRGRKGKKPDMVFGERAYQTVPKGAEGPPHVKDGFPVRVRVRTGKET